MDRLRRRTTLRGGDNIWSDVQNRMGTLHKILRCLRSRGGRTPHMFKQRWGHRTKFYGASEAKGGTPHIPFEAFW